MNPHNNQSITKGRKTYTFTRIAIAPWMKPAEGWRLRELELLEQRARDLRVNVSTHHRSSNAPQVGSEYTVRVRGDAGEVELRADGDLLAIIEGALQDYEALPEQGYTAEELVVIAAQSGIEVSRG